LTGFPEAIQAAYPKTKVQLCIVHLVRHSLKYVKILSELTGEDVETKLRNIDLTEVRSILASHLPE
jgi:transposase-like protein